MDAQDDTVDRLLEKSKESFVLAVELYNRPTLRYHAESCSIFLCNAWELMLKAHLVRTKGIDSIYEKNDDTRTISLSECLRLVFTNSKDPLRVNMAEIVKFRNTNTHFITDEYEIFYGPFLQAAVSNFADKLMELHGHSVSDLMPENHLSLSIKRGTIDPDVIRAKYEPAVAEKLLEQNSSVVEAAGEGSNKIAAIYETTFRLVKKAGEADLNVYLDKEAKVGAAIIRDVKDATSYFPFTAKTCIDNVNKLLAKRKVAIYVKGKPKQFNQYHFQQFVKVFGLKGNEAYSYDRKVRHETQSSWIYSNATVNLIANKLTEDPQHCLDKLAEKIKK